jgi:hypothetical protein
MGEASGSDRRKYTRIGTDQVISFAPVDAQNLLGVSSDVSVGGIRFQAVGCEIDMGEVIRVTFNVGEQTLEAIGRVVWSTEVDPITLDIGLEFVEIDPVDLRLIEQETQEGFPS